jgi:hypothetical protein
VFPLESEQVWIVTPFNTFELPERKLSAPIAWRSST